MNQGPFSVIQLSEHPLVPCSADMQLSTVSWLLISCSYIWLVVSYSLCTVSCVSGKIDGLSMHELLQSMSCIAFQTPNFQNAYLQVISVLK